ncbi:hypothetical protein HDU91_004898 [Kappamyces sp. JEL0680]|nr:hypothetical protein HDU91_004898 [Kappamyces sp. JEL0680]
MAGIVSKASAKSTHGLFATDPTCEFATVLSLKKMEARLPKLKHVFLSLEAFLDSFVSETLVKPLIEIGSTYLDTVITRDGKRISKVWGTGMVLPENTAIPVVDSARKFLNFYARSGFISVDEWSSLKQHAVDESVAASRESERALLGRLVHSAAAKKEKSLSAIERYSYLHFRLLSESQRLDRSAGDMFLHSLQACIVELDHYSQKMVQLQTHLMELDAELDLAGVETDLGARSAQLVEELERNDHILDFIRNLHEFESVRIAAEEQRSKDLVVLRTLQTLASLRRRLDYIKDNGIMEGSLRDLKERMDATQIFDSSLTARKLVKKLSTLIDTAKPLVDAIVLLCQSVLRLAKGTNYPHIKALEECVDLWSRVKGTGKNITTVFKSYLATKQVKDIDSLVSLLAELDAGTEALFVLILNLCDLSEYQEEESSDSSDDDEHGGNSIRLNKEQSKNITALNVLLKVKAKLQGKVADEAKAPVSKQVEELIHQATSADNLSLMYEGWMSWI